MVTIEEPRLTVEPVPGAPGRRRLVVTFRLTLDPGIAPPVGGGVAVVERMVVTGRPDELAPTATAPLYVEVTHHGTLTETVSERRLVAEVDRTDLDVQADWWHTDQGGGVEPIAELLDHLAAVISVAVGEQPEATAETPVVTGSWGALGSD